METRNWIIPYGYILPCQMKTNDPYGVSDDTFGKQNSGLRDRPKGKEKLFGIGDNWTGSYWPVLISVEGLSESRVQKQDHLTIMWPVSDNMNNASWHTDLGSLIWAMRVSLMLDDRYKPCVVIFRFITCIFFGSICLVASFSLFWSLLAIFTSSFSWLQR